MKAKNLKPGEMVPVSGIYRVEHESHRLMHEATLLGNSLFPQCRQCGTAVRFSLVRAIHGKRVLPFRSSAILKEFERSRSVTRIAS
jgi:hypothetical protein